MGDTRPRWFENERIVLNSFFAENGIAACARNDTFFNGSPVISFSSRSLGGETSELVLDRTRKGYSLHRPFLSTADTMTTIKDVADAVSERAVSLGCVDEVRSVSFVSGGYLRKIMELPLVTGFRLTVGKPLGVVVADSRGTVCHVRGVREMAYVYQSFADYVRSMGQVTKPTSCDLFQPCDWYFSGSKKLPAVDEFVDDVVNKWRAAIGLN